ACLLSIKASRNEFNPISEVPNVNQWEWSFGYRVLVNTDTTTLSYWLNWRVFLCAIWVLTSIMIWKYDYSRHSESNGEGTQQGRACFLSTEEAWRPCMKEIHPVYLMAFRIIVFSLLLGTLIAEVVVYGGGINYYYTQWTLTLVTIYFGFGSLFSIYGCFQPQTKCSARHLAEDAEKGSYVPLTCGGNYNGSKLLRDSDQQGQGKSYVLQVDVICGNAFQVMFQMTAGAVMLTDFVYWCLIFPFLTIIDYDLNIVSPYRVMPLLAVFIIPFRCESVITSNLDIGENEERFAIDIVVDNYGGRMIYLCKLTVLAHSLNMICLLGETALNCLRFPLFRISYFILWTSVYVIFEWIVHAFVSIGWPYPFLELSSPYAPLCSFTCMGKVLAGRGIACSLLRYVCSSGENKEKRSYYRGGIVEKDGITVKKHHQLRWKLGEFKAQ
ncbi:hypothetical protein RJ639_035663, partial [Escallonia herrerae]